MYLSKYFLPILKENPSEAQIASHRLMLRSGMIKQSSAGIYSWLPLGLKVLKKIENIVIEEQIAAGHIPILMPTIQPAELWKESKRLDDYGKEMLRFEDRHGRLMLYGRTNEDLVTDIFRSYINLFFKSFSSVISLMAFLHFSANSGLFLIKFALSLSLLKPIVL